MHTVLTRQSIIMKCTLNKSIMTGNYEYYYSAGLLAKLLGQNIEADIKPDALYDEVQQMLKGFDASDDKEAHLKHMLTYYQPDERYDEQMAELLQSGLNENRMWTR